MNPCAKNRKQIALLASRDLDANATAVLREHLITCAGCREYSQGMSALAERLQSASDLPPAKTTPLFHQRLVKRISNQPGRSTLFGWAISIQRLWGEQRLAVFAVGAAFGIAAVVLVQRFQPRETRNISSHVAVVPAAAASTNTPSLPSLGSYRRAADTSLETLDDLLTRQAALKTPSAETLTVSSSMKIYAEN